RGGVEEVALEAVERLDRERDALLRRILRGGPVDFDDAREFVGGRAAARELAERLVERAGGDVAAERRGAVDQPFYVVERAGAFGLVGGDGALAAARHHADAGGAEAEPRE